MFPSDQFTKQLRYFKNSSVNISWNKIGDVGKLSLI